MKQKGHNTAFYIETLLLIVVFIGIILVLTRIFGMARKKSVEAREKTSAICLCQNTAEAFAAAGDSKELLDLLNEKDNASIEEMGDKKGRITAAYAADMTPDPKGSLKVEIAWEPDPSESGNPAGGDRILLQGTIQAKKGKKVIYTVTTSSYGKEGWK